MSKTPRLDKLDKNILINGNFNFWQRGTSTTTPGVYLADRWSSTSGVTSYSRQTGGPNANSQYFARIAGSSGTMQLFQKVESNFARSIVQDKLTLAFHAKANAGTPDINVIVDTPNVVDDYAAVTNVTSSNLGALTNSWQKFVVEIDVNSTMRSNGFQVRIGGVSISSAVEIDLAQVVILEGELDDINFALAGKTYADELMLCQRYYEKSYLLDVPPGSVSVFGSIKFNTNLNDAPVNVNVFFKVTKRVAPTVTLYDGVGNVNRYTGISNAGPLVDNVAAGGGGLASRNGQSGFQTDFLTVGYKGIEVLQWTADSEL